MTYNKFMKPQVAVVFTMIFFTLLVLLRGNGNPPMRGTKTSHSKSEVTRNLEVTDPQAIKLLFRQRKSADICFQGSKALRQSDLPVAENYFRQALKLDNNNLSAWTGLAQVLERQGKPSEALSAYRALTASPSFSGTFREPRVMMPYALLASQAGQWSEAVQAYETGREQHNQQRDSAQPPVDVAFDPQTPKPKELQAMAHLLLGAAYAKHYEEREKALVHYEAAVKAEPRSAIVQFYYGYGLRNANRREEANAAFEKAASLGQGEVKAAAQKMRR